MMVSATWFLWLALYASTSRWLNWSVADRTHIVSCVPSSGLAAVVVDVLPLPQAASTRARASTAATPAARRRRTPWASPRRARVAISAPQVHTGYGFDADVGPGRGVRKRAAPARRRRDRVRGSGGTAARRPAVLRGGNQDGLA